MAGIAVRWREDGLCAPAARGPAHMASGAVGEAALGRPDAPDQAWDGFGSKHPEERNMALCEGLIDVAAALFNVSGREMRQAGRTAQGVTRVRQIAMYVAHTIFRIKMGEVGRCFGRDRTTVLHACQVVEDLRDDDEFDHLVSVTERVALAAFGSRVPEIADRPR